MIGDALRPAGAEEATIVIPQHGLAELTIGCVRSLRRADPRPWPIVVVDDGSPRADRIAIRGELTDEQLIEQPHRGVSAAWNRGASHVETPFVIFLNNDVRTAAPWVDAIVTQLRDGVRLCGVAWREERALPAQILEQLPTRRYVEGWCWGISVESFRRLGGCDEAFRLYFSDTDLQVRLAREHGVTCLTTAGLTPQTLVHQGHQSTRRLAGRRSIWRVDRDRFISKWRAG